MCGWGKSLYEPIVARPKPGPQMNGKVGVQLMPVAPQEPCLPARARGCPDKPHSRLWRECPSSCSPGTLSRLHPHHSCSHPLASSRPVRPLSNDSSPRGKPNWVAHSFPGMVPSYWSKSKTLKLKNKIPKKENLGI